MTMRKPDLKVDRKLLELLVCPITKDTLVYDATANRLVSKKVGLAFPIVGGIPIMLVDYATQIE